ncbi:MAG: endo-1,4-beta-xylanase [Opitutales bacterium]|nr:endo-1,4-beta-xylanase [Opitutales bacterium]MCH8541032.1 endo-1,4-beta-xylanase [Opitutales bacterium]
MMKTRFWLPLSCLPLLGSFACLPAESPIPDWRTMAEERIEAHRKGDFTLPNDGPEGAVKVFVELDRHEFAFGTALANHVMRDDHPMREPYLDFVRTYFNTVVSENEMKWYTIEPERHLRDYRTAERFMDFARENDMKVRGHTLFWAKEQWVDDWVKELSDEDLRWHVKTHLDNTVNRFKGRIWAWDVNNEMIAGDFYKSRLGSEIREYFYRRAKELDPEATYFVNDYAMLADSSYDTPRFAAYLEQIQNFLDNGVPVGGIGIQEHQAARFTDTEDGHPRLDPFVIWDRLDRLAEFGLPIHITEVSFPTECPDRRAEELDIFFHVMFAHEAVEAILLWGFWRRAHFLGDKAPLFDEDFEVLPAGERFIRLMEKDFHTEKEISLEGNDATRFRGFYGDYSVRWLDQEGEVLQVDKVSFRRE